MKKTLDMGRFSCKLQKEEKVFINTLCVISFKQSRQEFGVVFFFLPCKSLSSFLVASSRVWPIKVALFHLYSNSCDCRQQACLGWNKETKLSARRSHFRRLCRRHHSCSAMSYSSTTILKSSTSSVNPLNLTNARIRSFHSPSSSA